MPEKVVRVIEAIYRNPKFAGREMGKRSSERRQYSGIRQGCPLSPYLFIIDMTVIMRDINSRLTQEERNILRNEQPLGMRDMINSCMQMILLSQRAVNKPQRLCYTNKKSLKQIQHET